MLPRAPAAGGEQQHAGGESDNADPGQRTERLADQRGAQGRRHQRRRAAGNRIDLAKVPDPIAFAQSNEIQEMNDDGGDHPWPRLDERQAHKRQQYERDHARPDGDEGGRCDGVHPALDGGVPAGMAGGSEQHGGEDGGIHYIALLRSVRLEDVVQHEMHEFGRDHEYQQQKHPSARLRRSCQARGQNAPVNAADAHDSPERPVDVAFEGEDDHCDDRCRDERRVLHRIGD